MYWKSFPGRSKQNNHLIEGLLILAYSSIPLTFYVGCLGAGLGSLILGANYYPPFAKFLSVLTFYILGDEPYTPSTLVQTTFLQNLEYD
jgi:hypothetical protein